MSKHVLVSCPHLQRDIAAYAPLLAAHGITVELPAIERQQLSERELLEMIGRFDGAVIGDDQFTARVLERASGRLKVVVKWGIGVDAIDLAAAARFGIDVVNTPGALSEEVADVVLGYIILLTRQLHVIDRTVRQGEWMQIRGRSLQGKTLGVIGVGAIGQAVIRRAHALGMIPLGYDLNGIPVSLIEQTNVRSVSLHELLASADIVSLNCSLTDANRHMLSEPEFSLMKPGMLLINTARGQLIDEAALVQSLANGTVSGAALDVYEEEPLPLDSSLRRFDNCIFGTHNSSNTVEAVRRVNDLAIQKLLDAFQ